MIEPVNINNRKRKKTKTETEASKRRKKGTGLDLGPELGGDGRRYKPGFSHSDMVKS